MIAIHIFFAYDVMVVEPAGMLKRVSTLVTALLMAAGSAAFAAAPGALLKGLPAGARASLAPMFTANAIGQTGLNGQLKATPQALIDQLRASLTKAGYSEQPIRTTIGAWGFSATWAPPSGTTVDGTPSGQTAVLVTQATALSPDTLNLNIRFEGIAASTSAASAQPSQQPSGLSLPRGLF